MPKPKNKQKINFEAGAKVKTRFNGQWIFGMVTRTTWHEEQEAYYCNILESGGGRIIKAAQYNVYKIARL